MIKASLKARDVEKKNLNDYKALLTKKQWSRISGFAKAVRGVRVMHINTTPNGGGVAEMLKSIVPLEQELGLESSWYTTEAPQEFFVVTKKIHNALQSAPIALTEKEKFLYLDVNWEIAKSLRKLPRADIYVIHDPQPTAVIASFHESPMISRIHIDLSNPNTETLSFFLPFFNQYDRIIFSMREFAVPGVTAKKEFALPAIDPLVPKNMPLNANTCHQILQEFDINPDRPLISQISRFDPWKDPLGVIDAYYHVKNDIPDLQLALVGIIQAKDDPEALEVFERVKKHASGDPDIFLFANPEELQGVSNDTLVNAVQAASDIVLQKSLKEGFGLTVTEAMWKGKAVVAGNVGGVKKQIRNGKDGFLVNSVEEAAKRVRQILRDEKLKKRLGRSARTRVKNKFLITRHVADHLKMYKALLN